MTEGRALSSLQFNGTPQQVHARDHQGGRVRRGIRGNVEGGPEE